MIRPSTINTSRISRASPARYVTLSTREVAGQNGAIVAYAFYGAPASARLVDVVIYQLAAGTTGTSIAVDVRTSAGTSMLTAAGVMTLAAGANQKTDARGDIALPSGWTRPAVKTDATALVTEGSVIQVYTTETGVYGSHPTILVALIFEPIQ